MSDKKRPAKGEVHCGSRCREHSLLAGRCRVQLCSKAVSHPGREETDAGDLFPALPLDTL